MVPFLFFLLLFVFPLRVHAVYDPLSVPNNKYGIHIADTNDIPDVPALVNSTGGDWGYVTLVIPETDRNSEKWQKIFDDMRRLHLIPLVRLATRTVDDHWAKPTEESVKDWVPFLTSLNWPVENRYVILFNEPNHAKEWGGTINPREYAQIAVDLAQQLKASSSDFYILPAGLDASAASDGESMDEATFLQDVVREKSEFLNVLDGWTSHSYPNPGFSGSPYARGRGTLTTFYWELDVLRGLGLKKDLPVFITETGWMHSQGKAILPRLSTPEVVAKNLRIASQTVWIDQRIVAVTPFVFSYQDEPFDHFSWKKFRQDYFYLQYYQYQTLTKVRGQPRQHEVFSFSKPLIPASLVAGSTYSLTADIINLGQSILDRAHGYELVFDDSRGAFPAVLVEPLPLIEPNQKGTVLIHLKTNQKDGIYPLNISLRHAGRKIELGKQDVILVTPPALRLAARLGWRKSSVASDATVLVYDLKDKLIAKFSNQKLQNGTLSIFGLTDIVPGERYRVVVLVPYYVPRQEITVLGKTVTNIKLKRFLPLDFDNDGTLTPHDLATLLQTKPNAVISRFISP